MSRVCLLSIFLVTLTFGAALADWRAVVIQSTLDYFTPLAAGESGLRCFGGNVSFPKTKCRGWLACQRLQENCRSQCLRNSACRAWTTAKVSCWKFGEGARCERGHKSKYHSGFVNHH